MSNAHPIHALLLCAGLGTRFRPNTDHTAKPALPFMNIPMMGYNLFYLESLGLANLVLNTHHLPETVQTAAKALTIDSSYKVQFSHEPIILGSGGGIQNARHLLMPTDNFIVANGDEVFFFNHGDGLRPLLEFHKQNNALATLLTTNHPEAGRILGGVWSHPDNHIYKLGGQGEEPDPQHFTGVFVFSPRIFEFMPAPVPNFHIFNDCLHKAIAAGESVMSFHDPELMWLDMTSERDYVASTRRLLIELEKDSVYAQQFAKILSRYGQSFERTADRQWFGPGAKFEGKLDDGAYLFLGENAAIAANVEVKDFAVLGPNALFEQGYLEGATITQDTHVHEMTSLRRQLT